MPGKNKGQANLNRCFTPGSKKIFTSQKLYEARGRSDEQKESSMVACATPSARRIDQRIHKEDVVWRFFGEFCSETVKGFHYGCCRSCYLQTLPKIDIATFRSFMIWDRRWRYCLGDSPSLNLGSPVRFILDSTNVVQVEPRCTSSFLGSRISCIDFNRTMGTSILCSGMG